MPTIWLSVNFDFLISRPQRNGSLYFQLVHRLGELTDLWTFGPLDQGDDYPIVFTILSAFATFERERIAARIREVKQLKKAQGKFTGGRRAFGYDVIDGVKVPREDEQAVIAVMRQMRAAGSGYREIAEWMAATQERKMTFMGVKKTLS
jgi:hypothetical protein